MSHHNSSHPEPVGKMPERQILTSWSARRAGRQQIEMEFRSVAVSPHLENRLLGQHFVVVKTDHFQSHYLQNIPSKLCYFSVYSINDHAYRYKQFKFIISLKKFSYIEGVHLTVFMAVVSGHTHTQAES